MNFGKNIKELRLKNNLSQQAFAKLFNISRAAVGSYEEERAEPKLDTLIKISTHFNISVEDLLFKKTLKKEENIVDLNKTSKKIYIEDRLDLLEQKVKILEQKIKELS